MKYSDYFRKIWITTSELKKPIVLEKYKKQGFIWIRKLTNKRFENIVRNPTIGCTVELFFLWQPNCVPIDSPQAKKLINKLCYF
jgi:hypothetical protein